MNIPKCKTKDCGKDAVFWAKMNDFVFPQCYDCLIKLKEFCKDNDKQVYTMKISSKVTIDSNDTIDTKDAKDNIFCIN